MTQPTAKRQVEAFIESSEWLRKTMKITIKAQAEQTGVPETRIHYIRRQDSAPTPQELALYFKAFPEFQIKYNNALTAPKKEATLENLMQSVEILSDRIDLMAEKLEALAGERVSELQQLAALERQHRLLLMENIKSKE